MAFEFKKAARTAKKIRVAVDGPSGAGKTYTLLRLAAAMRAAGLCRRVAVIDSENGGSESYAGESPDGPVWEFDVLNLTTYSPTTYVQAIGAACEAGYDCVVIDSLSHAWMGKDGALDLVDRKGGRFDAWKDVTPLQRQLIDAIIQSPAHVLASMRTKSEYVVEKDERGKSVPRKVGLAPVQRDGVEFEFDVYGTIDQEHAIRVTKSRCSAMQDAYALKPDARFWQPLVRWLTTAAPVLSPESEARRDIAAAATLDDLGAVWTRIPVGVQAKVVGDKDRRKAELSRPAVPAGGPDLEPLRLELEEVLLEAGMGLADALRAHGPACGVPAGSRLPGMADLTGKQLSLLADAVRGGGALFDGGEADGDPTATVRH